MTFFIVSVSVALVVSFFCSLAEATLLSLTPSQVAEISQKYPRLGAIWRRFKERIDRPIAIILILNTTAHTIGASIAGASFDALYGDEWIWLFGLIFTFLMLQFTELLPKSLGVRHNRALAMVIARPLDIAVTVLRPLLAALHLLNRPFEGKATKGDRSRTTDEISALAGMARLSSEINLHQEKIISGAARLSTLTARDIMIARPHVRSIPIETSLLNAMVSAHIDAHTRYPIAEQGRLVGYVNFKEIVAALRTNPRDPSLSGIMHPLISTPETTAVSDLLRRFVDEHIHISQVIDVAGTCVGIITMEDIVEELMGDIQDEFDRLPRHCHSLGQGQWLVGGGLPIAEFTQRCGIAIAGGGNLSEAILGQMEGEPKAGAIIRIGSAVVTVRRVRRGRIFEVAVISECN